MFYLEHSVHSNPSHLLVFDDDDITLLFLLSQRNFMSGCLNIPRMLSYCFSLSLPSPLKKCCLIHYSSSPTLEYLSVNLAKKEIEGMAGLEMELGKEGTWKLDCCSSAASLPVCRNWKAPKGSAQRMRMLPFCCL